MLGMGGATPLLPYGVHKDKFTFIYFSYSKHTLHFKPAKHVQMEEDNISDH
jgi:hypothetical protein